MLAKRFTENWQPCKWDSLVLTNFFALSIFSSSSSSSVWSVYLVIGWSHPAKNAGWIGAHAQLLYPGGIVQNMCITIGSLKKMSAALCQASRIRRWTAMCRSQSSLALSWVTSIHQEMAGKMSLYRSWCACGLWHVRKVLANSAASWPLSYNI